MLSFPHPLLTCESPGFSRLRPLWELPVCGNRWRRHGEAWWRGERGRGASSLNAPVPLQSLQLRLHNAEPSGWRIQLRCIILWLGMVQLWFCHVGYHGYLHIWTWESGCRTGVGSALLCWGALSYFLLWNAIGSCSGFCPSLLLLAEWRGGTPFPNIVLWLV